MSRNVIQFKDKDSNVYDVKDVIARQGVSALNATIGTKAPVIYENASGLLVDINDGAEGMPFKSISVDITPRQGGSGDPSPSNIRTIRGFTRCRLTRSGVNMCGGDFLRDNVKLQLPGATINTDNKYISFSSGDTTVSIPGEYGFTGSLYGKFKSNTKYSIIFTYYKNSGNGANIKYAYTNGDVYNMPTVTATQTKGTYRVVTLASNTLGYIYKSASSGKTQLYYDESGIFEGDVAIADFVPYNGKTITIDWESIAGTVFGGSFDVMTGKLIVTQAEIASYNGETLPGAWISDRDVYVEGGTPTTGAQVVYELAEPIEYQLTGDTSLTTLYGKNYLSCNTGTVTVTYPADTKLYIEHLTKPTEDDMVANGNIASGAFFMIGNRLFKSTAAIAAGETIIPGTNCTELSLADALNNLNS